MSRLSPALHVHWICVLSLFVASSSDAAVIFAESFDGALDNTWNTGAGDFPTDGQNYVGPPSASFTILGGAQVYHMTTVMNDSERVGLSSAAAVPDTTTLVEARINTHTQNFNNIDGLFELLLVNDTDNTKYVGLSLFGASFSSTRVFQAKSSIDGLPSTGFNYANDTWYRFRLTSNGSTLRASIYDASATELVGHTFSHALAALGNSFHIAFDQYLGIPHQFASGTFMANSAVDYISAEAPLETAAILPEPSACALLVAGIAALAVGNARRRSRTERPSCT